MKEPFILGIAGGTGSGKTTLARNLLAALPAEAAEIVSHDFYYRDIRTLPDPDPARVNFDHPEALETSLFIRHLDELKCGRAVDVPQYDFATHTRKAETRRVVPRPVIIVEGILIFADDELCRRFDARVFVHADPEVRLLRRIERDVEKRGRSIASVREQYLSTVLPMHRKYVAPSVAKADIIIPRGGHNKAAVEMLVSYLRSVTGIET